MPFKLRLSRLIPQLFFIALLAWFGDAFADHFFFHNGEPHSHPLLNISVHEHFMRGSLALFTAMLWLLHIYHTIRSSRDRIIEKAFNNSAPICITDTDFNIVTANDSYWEIFSSEEFPKNKPLLKCYDHRPGAKCHNQECPLTKIKGGAKEYFCETSKTVNGETNHFLITVKPILDGNKLFGISETFHNITERLELEEQKEELIRQLNETLDQVRTLRGFIPICASCKKIRDDKGYWNQLEAYVQMHSHAEFSHSLCPDCVEGLYGDLNINNSDRIEADPIKTDPII
ncbi:MAG: hypothetical protein CVV64_15705 [Candidatus Wallbacteria bacterium HGW-Wallbacteria-1]|uniref:PAS domain-containing protein n=1 Tax=Candidatus Wallbacteria bacterium HGW-Wallbacteria-1 TaxID=2013854 RepID=A0A2N1PLE3_9BACT|nr:MAG: hypothetical protein CVV64_15705 [Candidatus Wallbacteria bacterium HGW-Wallbacteria-1]